MLLKFLAASFVFFLLISVGVHGQQQCPAPQLLTPSPALNIFSPQQELDLGDLEAERVEGTFRVIHDDELAAHLNAITKRILAQLPPTQLQFRIILIDLPEVNAFSVGAGRIYITRKMIAYLHNDEELASLLGHEMGHILAHQNAIEMTRELHDILGIDSVGDRKDISDKLNRLLDNLARDRGLLVKTIKRESQQEEPRQFEADRLGLYAIGAAGFAPQAMPQFFDRYTQLHGKTGSLLSDLFGATKPNEKRLREMRKSLSSLPQACREMPVAPSSAEFQGWQANVLAYSGLGVSENLVAVTAKKSLSPPLRTDLVNLKFSSDGEYSLAQDDASIFVFANHPYTLLFRIDAPDTYHAQFSPDSQNVVFLTEGLRVEEWNIDDQERSSVHEIALPEGCLHAELSHDGKLLACVNRHLDFLLIDVESGAPILTKSAYFDPTGLQQGGLRFAVFLLTAMGNGRWVHIGFSPDDRYVVAAGASQAIGVDISNRAQISLHGALGGMLSAGFAFLASDRIIVQNAFDPKNSAVIEFPSGKVLERVPINPRQEMRAPSRGNYVILSPVKDAQVGLLDLASQNFVIGSNKSSVLDVYDREVLIQRASGEVGIFDLATHQAKGQVTLPKSTLGPVRAWAASPDLNWLAVSGATRGAVWNLSSSERVYHTRAFHGAYFGTDQSLYIDFPAQDPQPRTVARASLSQESIVPGLPIGEKVAAHQYGAYLIVRKPAGKDELLTHNINLEVQDVRDGHSLWSRNFPKEAPRLSMISQSDSLILDWHLDVSAAKDEVSANPSLQARYAALRDHKDAYLLELLDPASGKLRGQLLIDTGKGSFRVERAFSQGDWVLIGDNENRTHIYSLATGERKGIVFGRYSTLSAPAGLMLVENKPGEVDVYSLDNLEKQTQLTFPYGISAWSFSADGQKLLVLTANQVVYLFDTQALRAAKRAE